LFRRTTTGAAYSGKGYLKSVVLQGGSANSTVDVRDGTAGTEPILFSLAAVIGSSTQWRTSDADGVFVSLGVHATLTGAGSAVTIEME
jgi:hypothetical protein